VGRMVELMLLLALRGGLFGWREARQRVAGVGGWVHWGQR
jgi:hypothetical protein